MEYTTKTAIENWLLKDIDASFDDQITEWIKAMSNQMDLITKRNLYRTEEETYKYDGDGSSILHIKDCHTITEITLNDSVVEPVQYPANKPYTSRIVLEDKIWTKGLQNVTVTAIQSMNVDLPEDIKFACTVLVGGLINTQILGVKKGSTERIGNYSITYKDDQQFADYNRAMSILKRYSRIAL